MSKTPKMLKVAMTGLAIVVLNGGVAPALAGSDDPKSVSLEQPEHVSLEELEIDADVNYEGDWRIELDAEGTSTIILGPGTSGRVLEPGTVKFAGTEVQKGVDTRASNWVCTTTPLKAPIKSLGQLEVYAGAVCDNGRPGTMRLLHYYERSSWSGWRLFTDHRNTSWTSAQTQGTNIYAQCISSGGTYDYRARVGIQVAGAGSISTPVAVGPKGRFTCGTGVS